MLRVGQVIGNLWPSIIYYMIEDINIVDLGYSELILDLSLFQYGRKTSSKPRFSSFTIKFTNITQVTVSK